MISRVWHGWTTPKDAEEYERMLRTDILPGIHRVRGYQGAYLLRREDKDEVEFVTITMFENLDAVRGFAGEDYTRPVIHPRAQQLLTRFDAHSAHYETLLTPADIPRLRTEME